MPRGNLWLVRYRTVEVHGTTCCLAAVNVDQPPMAKQVQIQKKHNHVYATLE